MTFTFIINPAAGRGRFSRPKNPLERAARKAGLDFRIAYTSRRAHAAELAERAASQGSVVAVGGDGTIHEVVSGLLRTGRNAPFAIIPAGTGNDFAKMLDIPRNLDEAVRQMKTARARPVDVGRVTWDGPEGPGAAWFVNVAGAGIDAKVAAAATGFKALRGTPRYLAAVLAVLRTWETPRCQVELCADARVVHLDEDILLALVGNGRCAAGGFYLTPDAVIDDGRIDACIVKAASTARILRLLPRVLFGGRHGGQPEVLLEKVTSVRVISSVPVPIQADGEVLVQEATTIQFDVEAGALPVLQPVKT